MPPRIIVGYDDGEGARDALALGRLLAAALDAEPIVTAVLPEGDAHALSSAAVADLSRQMERDLSERTRAAAIEVGGREEIVRAASPAKGLHDVAEDMEADAIVVGCHAGLPGQVRAGHTALRLLQGAPCAVALAPVGHRHVDPTLRVLGVGLDGSDESRGALASAIELADGGTLRLMAVAPIRVEGSWAHGSWGQGLQGLGESAPEIARRDLDEAVALTPAGLRPSTTVLIGDAAAELAEEASKGVDLLCLGSRGFGPLRRVLLGSVSSTVVRDAPCPVLVVPRRRGFGAQAAECAAADAEQASA